MTHFPRMCLRSLLSVLPLTSLSPPVFWHLCYRCRREQYTPTAWRDPYWVMYLKYVLACDGKNYLPHLNARTFLSHQHQHLPNLGALHHYSRLALYDRGTNVDPKNITGCHQRPERFLQWCGFPATSCYTNKLLFLTESEVSYMPGSPSIA